jgi:GH18 family chitinase
MRLKGEYVASQDLAGAMFWELSHDNGQLLDALRDGLGYVRTRSDAPR